MAYYKVFVQRMLDFVTVVEADDIESAAMTARDEALAHGDPVGEVVRVFGPFKDDPMMDELMAEERRESGKERKSN